MSATTIAFIGDAIYDLYIRMELLKKHPRYNNHELTKQKFSLVKAAAQATVVKALMDDFNEEELRVLKWGRNAKVTNIPKGSTVGEYHLATAFETLIGHLYLYKKIDRANEIMRLAFDILYKDI